MADSHLINLIKPLVDDDGFCDTLIPNVRLMKCAKSIPRMPFMYRPGLTIIAQGQKIGYFGDKEIHYNPGHFLVQSLPLPFECETFATLEQPLLGISIDVNFALLSELVSDSLDDYTEQSTPSCPMSSVPVSQDMAAALVRLVRAMYDPRTAKIMGASRVREVIFEALQNPEANVLRELVVNQGQFSRIVQCVQKMNALLNQEVRVEKLAEEANMSVSSFHHHFKNVSGSSPLQYLKQLRLLKAQMLLNQGGLNVGQIGFEVGYKSIHQFSRDYKRYFGSPPTQDKQRENAVV
ncbi:AraC family transcriptional regulator [Marinomonas sp. IMCC 4694]|uniref:AraC family transcriptional regulator n=1 Tax=Marinomonas sp. IMCC 4694 TaxID=2605432 RepID=UPI0011E84C95|nr:AraC family transcriptional regulator [Marinomonas sp. IMCC 4694]TYL49322.1 AraC family transcriptional regulator [Marinomonas sp. IMCC 4694]